MLQAVRRAAAIAAIAVCALQASPRPSQLDISDAVYTQFVGARVMDGTGRAPIENATIVVHRGRIVSVGRPESIPRRQPSDIVGTVDLRGKTVIPGLVNAHGHVSNPERDLRKYAVYGVTTVFSLGDEQPAVFAARDAQNRPDQSRTRVFVAGPVLAPATVADIPSLVARNVEMKADVLKIRVDDTLGTTQKMPPEIYQAVIREAHARGQRVAVHLFYLADAKAVLDAGADFIAHSVRDADVDADLIARLKARNVCLCTTLMREVASFVYESTPEFFSDPFFLKYADPQQVETLKQPARQESMRTSTTTPRYKVTLEVASRNLKRLSDAGVTIAMGTDTGSLGRFQGYFELMELELMVKAGLTPQQALLAATRDAARCQRIDAELGTLERGKWADFVVLDANPLTDIRNVRAIHDVYIAGNRLTR